MAGRPGFLGRPPQGEALERDAESGFGSALPAGFDPVWGTLGAPTAQADEWLPEGEEETLGLAVDVEVLGDGFGVSGQIRTGQFDRLTDWINMQSGFIAVRDASRVHLGGTRAPNADGRNGTIWVRLDQVILVAERTPVSRDRPGAPVVRKERRRVAIGTAAYNLRGDIHVHAHASVSQFLESLDPHFLPITDIVVNWLSDAAMVARFQFALVNRMQLVTLLDDAGPSADEVATD
jgi:hypothetical protein